MSYSFNSELKQSESAISPSIGLLTSYFGGTWSKSSLEMDKKGSDVSNGSIHCDIKLNKYTAYNYIVEWSMSNGSLGGSVDDSKITDYLLWVCSDEVLLIDFKKLRTALQGHRESILSVYGSQTIRSHRGTSRWSVEITKLPMSRISGFICNRWSRDEYDGCTC